MSLYCTLPVYARCVLCVFVLCSDLYSCIFINLFFAYEVAFGGFERHHQIKSIIIIIYV